MKPSRRDLVTLVLALGLVLAGVSTSFAAVWTDQPDYEPGSTVTIHGDNSDGAGYLADEPIFVEVWGPNGFHVSSAPNNPTAAVNGAWSWQLPLWDTEAAVGDYTYTATGLTSNVSQSGTFTDASYTLPNCEFNPKHGDLRLDHHDECYPAELHSWDNMQHECLGSSSVQGAKFRLLYCPRAPRELDPLIRKYRC